MPTPLPLSKKKTTASASCHCGHCDDIPNDGKYRPRIAFVGAPNAGKSTLFNALTGAKAKMGNWPGTTVEVSRGLLTLDFAGDESDECALESRECEAIDFPGTYSLDPLSPDEALTPDMLFAQDRSQRPDLVIVVVDAATLGRSLYLLAQLVEHPLRLGVVVTKSDVAQDRGITVNEAALSEALSGIPVAVVDPRRGAGIEKAREVLRSTYFAQPRQLRRGALEPGTPAATAVLDQNAVDQRFHWIDGVVNHATGSTTGAVKKTFTERFDRLALHPLGGPLLFLAAMWCVFQITTTVAAPLQDALDTLFSGPITDWASAGFEAIGMPVGGGGVGGVISGLVVNGLIAGVGTVLTFAPLMALMFICLSVLEDSGYMARAAVVTDRLMRTIGLPGKAFIPLIVGFGCNVPAISATRVLGKPAHRLLTCLLIPFASCSARLTVFAMLAATFFPAHAGSVVFAMYLISVGLIVLAGFVLKNFLRKSMGMDPLIIDLPVYQIPGLKLIASVTWVRLKGFLQTAGGIIVVTVAVVFALQSVPTSSEYTFADPDLPAAESVYGKVSEAVSPVFAPAGYGDWRTTGTLITGFVAKEAVISSWAQTFSLEDVTDETPEDQKNSDLATAIRADFESTSGGHALAAVWAFMIFLLAYTPCVATLGAQRREIGTKWTLVGVIVQLILAWVLSVAVFQILSLWM